VTEVAIGVTVGAKVEVVMIGARGVEIIFGLAGLVSKVVVIGIELATGALVTDAVVGREV
jgi:hypothetical protein